MMSIVRKYIPVGDHAERASASEIITEFETVRARYSEFLNISFDYEVDEKAQSVAVGPFNGQWKDLGTWCTLTDELKKPVLVMV